MGGLVILIGIILSVLMWSNLKNIYVLFFTLHTYIIWITWFFR